MMFVIGFVLGLVVAYAAPLLMKWRDALAPRTSAPQTEASEESRRRTERAWREYRNFMTYDGYAQQDDPS